MFSRHAREIFHSFLLTSLSTEKGERCFLKGDAFSSMPLCSSCQVEAFRNSVSPSPVMAVAFFFLGQWEGKGFSVGFWLLECFGFGLFLFCFLRGGACVSWWGFFVWFSPPSTRVTHMHVCKLLSESTTFLGYYQNRCLAGIESSLRPSFPLDILPT